jgi:hypothetical protein
VQGRVPAARKAPFVILGEQDTNVTDDVLECLAWAADEYATDETIRGR